MSAITAADVEECLDILAAIMARAGKRARLGVPLWNRLQAEAERLREEEAVIAAARRRFEGRSHD